MTNRRINKILPAVKIAVLIGAGTHVVMVLLHSILTGEWWRLNAFALLQLDLLFPSIVEGTGWFIISYLFFTLLIGLIYFFGVLR